MLVVKSKKERKDKLEEPLAHQSLTKPKLLKNQQHQS